MTKNTLYKFLELRNIIIILSLFITTTINGKDNLLPYPKILENHQGHLIQNKDIAHWSITTQYVEDIENVPKAKCNRKEAYELEITPKGINIKAITPQGAYYAKQTLLQLSQKTPQGYYKIPCCKITDWAAFPFRGFMHDTGRSYISIAELKKEIKLLSHFKINTFHWHLTEDIAWRIESDKYPQLNHKDNMLRDKGKYYTKEEIKDFLQFCKQHYVLVIPEIDMPGHSAAFTKSIGHKMQTTKGMQILKEVIDELCDEVFTNLPYIHIGTDEVKFTNPDFVPQMVAHFRTKNKKVISWNPGWNYKKGEIDMLQLWSYRGRVFSGIPAIDSRYHYLNHFDTFGDIIALYNSRIGNSKNCTNEIKGAILAIWNDRKLENEKQIILQNNFYPNILALAERAWAGNGNEYFDKDGTILRSRFSKNYIDFADFERRMLWYKKHLFQGEPFAYTKQTHIEWNITDAFPNNGDTNKKFPPENQLDTIYTYQNKTYRVHPVYGASAYLRHTWGALIPGFYKKPKENHTAYAYTWVYAEREQKSGLWIEFQNYSRSEKDLAPLQNKWDYRGSKIWLNDKEILPPVWKNTHTEKSNEISLQNENLTSRKPIEVTLKKGWNKVLIKLPIKKFTSEQIRLQKWMFTAIFVNTKNCEALENIYYSRNKKLKTKDE